MADHTCQEGCELTSPLEIPTHWRVVVSFHMNIIEMRDMFVSPNVWDNRQVVVFVIPSMKAAIYTPRERVVYIIPPMFLAVWFFMVKVSFHMNIIEMRDNRQVLSPW